MNKLQWLKTRLPATVSTVVALALTGGIIAFALSDAPVRLGWKQPAKSSQDLKKDDKENFASTDHEHDGHDHEDESIESIQINSQARANLGLKTEKISLGTFTEYVDFPGVVAEWPGRTHVVITSPLTGVIHSIDATRGAMVNSGEVLFSIRLTHQDLVNTQEKFLQMLGELDVEEREIERLSNIKTGVVAGKALLERKYQRDKLQAGLRASRQSLILHGLSESQVEMIERNRELVREVVVRVPVMHDDRSLHHDSLESPITRGDTQSSERYASLNQPPPPHPKHIDAEFLVTRLDVKRGQSVEAGDPLAQLSNYSDILVEGHGFQRDAAILRQALESNAPVQIVLSNGDDPDVIEGLKIISLANEVDRHSRALPFYVSLTNRIEHSEVRDGVRYVSWLYKPGQRLSVRVPISEHGLLSSKIKSVIVVPKSAVAQSGSERFVFVDHGDHFDRIPVRVVASDSFQVALAVSGNLRSGKTIAITGTHLLQMEIKNNAGTAIDPHAGHNH